MKLFLRKHEKKIEAMLSCFDRMLFRGYLPIRSGWAMAQFLNQKHIRCPILKDFLSENGCRINGYAEEMAAKLGRPFQYLMAPTRKENLVRKLAGKEGIGHGLVCIFSVDLAELLPRLLSHSTSPRAKPLHPVAESGPSIRWHGAM